MGLGAPGWGVLVALGLVLGLALPFWRGPGPLGPPADRPLEAGLPGSGVGLGVGSEPVRLVVFGTSLSAARYDWPDRLEAALETCLNRPIETVRIVKPGANLTWAQTQIAAVEAAAPDLVLMEFAINDADLIDGLGRARAAAGTAALMAELAPLPVVLMTMSPARGLRGLARPRLAGHYADYRALAAARGAGLVDFEARWRALPRGARGLAADGLHPDPEIAAEIIVPVLVPYLAAAAGGRC